MSKRIYLSGYTRKNNRGISIVDFNSNGNSINFISTSLLEEENPSYIALSKDKSLLFSVSSRNDGGISLFKKEVDSYNLIDNVYNLGKAPCHLFFDENKDLLYSSNYHLGRLDILKVDSNNESIKLKLVNTISFSNKSIVSPTQDSSKCHMAIKDVDDRYLIVVDLGGDVVYTYSINIDGKAEIVSTYKTHPGMGPRHIEFSTCGEYAYLLGELDSFIEVLKYSRNKGVFTLIERVSMLPEGFSGENSGAAIKINNGGKFLYASNRGHDSIAIFQILEKEGRLNLKDIVCTGGKTPRDFGFDVDGNYLFIGHQESDFITVFKVDRNTGLIVRIDNSDIYIPEITCVLS